MCAVIDPVQIETRYARASDLHIAYQQFGEGDLDLVLIPGWASHVEQAWNFHEARISSSVWRGLRGCC
jgi:hypothetical protein